jgi:dTDP-4-amino-4,6-dideoxygalactose transaminase
MFTVLLPLGEIACTRKQFIEAMHAAGIGVGISYEAVHLTTLFRAKGFTEGRFPVSERIARETATLPLFPGMRETDVERVCAAMKQALRAKAPA